MRFVVLMASLALAATAANATAEDARKVCLERYDVEKSGDTIPRGMSKSTYMNQCTGSIRRAALQQQKLRSQSDAGETVEPSGGVNEVTVAPRPAKPVATMNKPVRVKTPVAVGADQ